MQTIQVKSSHRKGQGKGPARQLRLNGQVPAILYHKGAATPLQIEIKEVEQILRSTFVGNTLITLQMGGENEKTEQRLAILKETQRNPLTGEILHLDLFEISMEEPILMAVPIEIAGTAVGTKSGGILQHGVRRLDLRCLPSLMPDMLHVDVSDLKIGDSLHVRDITLPSGVEMISDPDRVVVTVVPPLSEAKMTAMLTATAKDTKEPEVIGQKEKEEEKDDKKGGKGDDKKAAGKEGGKK